MISKRAALQLRKDGWGRGVKVERHDVERWIAMHANTKDPRRKDTLILDLLILQHMHYKGLTEL